MVTKTTRLSLLALLALTYVSCSENLLDGGQGASSSRGRSATVQLKVSTAPEQEANGTTRVVDPNETEEGTAPNYKVSDLWLLEYGTDDRLMKDDKGSYVAKYITMEQLTANGGKLGVQLPRVGSADEYKCVLIANTHNDQLFGSGNLSDYETLDNIKKSSKDIKTFKDTYNTTAVSGKRGDLYLSCVEEVSANTTSLDCRFYRNVAKLTLKLENADKSGMKITGVQLCNVPDRLSYADRLYEGGTNDKFTLGASLMDFPEDDIVLNVNESKELVYYLPRNCQGSDASIKDVRKKNTSSKAFTSTCVKVFATDVKSEIPYCYTFYVGGNVTSDFNVRPNYHYTLPVEISGHGEEYIDSRVEDLAPMGANCIMMDLNKKDSIYTIYPHKRINKYWGYLEKDPDRTIKDDYEWEAVIIWQDTNENVIEFVESGKETFEGKGKQPLKIKLKSPTSPCNVLIGVKKKGVVPYDYGYLWSWHLWVTPYKPNRTKPWEKDRYEYDDSGVAYGRVFRYRPGYSSLNLSYNTLWDETNGEYKDKYIMDRNLGATTKDIPTPSHDLRNSAGLRYQFGRKDPFAIEGVTLYKAAKSSMQKNTYYAQAMYNGVKWPDWFYRVKKSPTWDWVDPNPYSGNLWNNPFPSEKDFKNKSFFDPCPEGWRIPLNGTWNIFAGGSNPWDNIKYSSNAWGSFNKGWYFYVGNGVTTFYPAGGSYDAYGDAGTGNTGLGVYGVLWSANPYNENYSYFISYRSGYVVPMGPANDIHRAEAHSIRCVQE